MIVESKTGSKRHSDSDIRTKIFIFHGLSSRLRVIVESKTGSKRHSDSDIRTKIDQKFPSSLHCLRRAGLNGARKYI